MYIYINVPFTIETINSTYGNAKIETIQHQKAFYCSFFVKYDSHYDLFYNGKVINSFTHYDSNEGFSQNIIAINWYKDSVLLTIEKSFERTDTIHKTFIFH